MTIYNLPNLSSRNIDTLLFDLDGTLIDMRNMAKPLFYLRAFRRFKYYFNPVSFYLAFQKSLRSVLRNDTSIFNHDVFIKKMAEYGRTTPQIIESLVSELVETDFRSLHRHFSPVSGAGETVSLAKRLGYKLILATNPVAPRNSVLYRLEWAGISPDNFAFITHSQNMNRCKPDIAFYETLLNKLRLKPDQCMMIGNDPLNDLPAQNIGILTLIIDSHYSRNNIRKYVNNQQGCTFGTYYDLIRKLQKQ